MLLQGLWLLRLSLGLTVPKRRGQVSETCLPPCPHSPPTPLTEGSALGTGLQGSLACHGPPPLVLSGNLVTIPEPPSCS